jgi:hypothetical protein
MSFKSVAAKIAKKDGMKYECIKAVGKHLDGLISK